jgi:hypothetical protein
MTDLEQLDFLYVPSSDVARDARWFDEVLGGRLVFAIDSMGTRVAMIELTDGPPRILLTDHLEDDRPILIYRVADLDAAVAGLIERSWQDSGRLEIPSGPCVSFRSVGGQRIALYQRTRPEVEEHFAGRRDF